jgi:hypothetical protein
MDQCPGWGPDSQTELVDAPAMPELELDDQDMLELEATAFLMFHQREMARSAERRNQAPETGTQDKARLTAATTEEDEGNVAPASIRDIETALTEIARTKIDRKFERATRAASSRQRRVVHRRPMRRTAPRRRGAGRPAARRTVTRSSAASGDSGDPDPSSPPSRAGTVARPRRSHGASRSSEEAVA